MERLTRDAVVRQFNVDSIPLLEEKDLQSEPVEINKRKSKTSIMMDNIWLLSYITIKKDRKTSFTYTPPETTPECCLISGRRRWCFSDEGTPGLLQSDKLLWRLACDRGAYSWSLQGEKHSSNLHWTDFNTNFSGGKKWVDLPLPLRLSSRTVLRLPRGANCRAKQSGWMLMPTKETMQGCCRECNMLASWRNSEKLRKASADCRCFIMVSGAKDGRVRKTGKVQTKICRKQIYAQKEQRVSRWLTCAVTLKIPLHTHLLFRLSISALTLLFIRPALST